MPTLDLRSKLTNPTRPILLYGTTPPRAEASDEQVARAAERLVARVRPLPLDGLIVYDVQDEQARTTLPRPFPFLPTIDSRRYARLLRDLNGTPTIAYKAVGATTEAAWQNWLTETAERYQLSTLSLVGRPSSRGLPRGLPLAQATQLAAAHPANFTLGGVAIAERHGAGRNEAERLVQKAQHGCRYFVSQAVYHAETTIRLLHDYARECQQQGVAPRPVILTFVPCGRAKTLDFIRWLGIAIDDATASAILNAAAPLGRSIDLCRANLRRILDQPYALPLPLGLNIESVSIHRDEIDASIDLFHALHELLQPRT